MKRSTLLVGLGMLLAFSCTKETNQVVMEKSTKSDLTSEAPYEIYEPQGEAYLELEAGILENLGREATAASCDVTKGIWLWESGMNYWFPSVEFQEDNSYVSDYGNEIIDERMIQLTLTNGEFENQSLRAEFINTYEDINNRVSGGLAHAFTDVQFMDIDDDVITLRVKSFFYLNPVFSAYVSTPQVPSATVDKMAGQAATCTWSPTTPAWSDAASRVRSVTPRPHLAQHTRFYSNVYEYSTYASAVGKRLVDGSYLPGNSSALSARHLPPMNGTTCMFIGEQNTYAQRMVDDIYIKLGKRTYWDGVSRFTIHPNVSVPSGVSAWGFYLDFATHYFYPVSAVQLAPNIVI